MKKKQQRDYESHNKSSTSSNIYIDAEVLLRIKKHKDRKGGKFTCKWLRPCVVSDTTKKVLVTLKNKNYKELNKTQLKHFFSTFGWYQETSRFPRRQN